MDTSKLKASMKALDALLEMVDDRDAEDAKRLKESGVLANKGSDAAMDTDDGGLGNKSPSEDASHKSVQEADGDGQSDEGMKSELKKMSASGAMGAKGALDMLLNEDDEDEDEE